MSQTPILERIHRLLAPGPSEHRDSILDASRKGVLKEPVRPMSDQELARAIREFHTRPVSEWTIAKLSRRPREASAPHDR